MAKNPKILSIVLAGGEGTRLMPLTRDRAKPAVAFGGVFRLIDFPLSNLVNSGYMQTVVLPQYKSHSLPPYLHCMAFLAAVGQLRLPCAGAAASRQALVSRLGRRHLPDHQHH